jgi:GntR family transcriptional regulator
MHIHDGVTGQSLDGIALYAKLAMTLRHRIARGEWKVGQRLPTVEQLAAELKVGKVTVRQAFALLSAAGLIESRRGRGTIVRQVPDGHPHGGIRAAINDMEVSQPDLEIRILDISAPMMSLPPHLSEIGRPTPPYVRIDKVHVNSGEPFSLMELYVAADVYARFPSGAERQYKIVKLLHDAKPGEVGMMHQRITVEPANEVIASQLNYTLAAPVACIRRTTLDKQDRILLTGLYWYRGDRFVLETTVPAELTRMHPSLSTPISR